MGWVRECNCKSVRLLLQQQFRLTYRAGHLYVPGRVPVSATMIKVILGAIAAFGGLGGIIGIATFIFKSKAARSLAVKGGTTAAKSMWKRRHPTAPIWTCLRCGNTNVQESPTCWHCGGPKLG